MAVVTQAIDPEKLAYALWVEAYPVKLKPKQFEVLWDMVLNPPLSDPMWKGVHEHWLEKANKLIDIMADRDGSIAKS